MLNFNMISGTFVILIRQFSDYYFSDIYLLTQLVLTFNNVFIMLIIIVASDFLWFMAKSVNYFNFLLFCDLIGYDELVFILMAATDLLLLLF